VKAEDEGDLLVRFQVARVVEEVRAAGLHFDHRPLVDHAVAGTIIVGTMQDRRCGARRARDLDERLLRAGDAPESQRDAREYQNPTSALHKDLVV
jgi:hypothetical protein